MRLALVTLAVLCGASSAYLGTWGQTTFASYSWTQLDTLAAAYASAPAQDHPVGASDVENEKRRRIAFPVSGALAVLLMIGAFFAPAGSTGSGKGSSAEAARLASFVGGNPDGALGQARLRAAGLLGVNHSAAAAIIEAAFQAQLKELETRPMATREQEFAVRERRAELTKARDLLINKA